MREKENLRNTISEEEQRVFIKFCYLLDYSASVATSELKKALGNKALSKKTVEKWLNKFHNGEILAKDGRGRGSPLTENRNKKKQQTKKLLKKDKGISVRTISQNITASKSTVHRILKEDLCLKKKLGQFVPHELTYNQRQNRILACQANLQEYRKHKTKLVRTLVLDETWVSLYMQPQKDQMKFWLEPNEVGPSAVLESNTINKRMLLMAMYFNGIAWYHLCEEKETITGDKYRAILSKEIPKWLRGKTFKCPILLHDNAKPHKAKVVQSFFRARRITEWKHPPYSPDLNTCDYDCFGPLKRELRGKKYTDWIQFENVLKKVISDGMQKGRYLGLQRLPERWKSVIEKEGHYI